VAQKQNKKMGRPKLPKGEAKSELIRARVTPSEYKSFENAAKSAGKDISEWARKTLIDAAISH
jgi:uncharacterized protein (DUF1778 family)